MEVRGQVDMTAAVTSATAEYKLVTGDGGRGLGFGRDGREVKTIVYSCREL